MKILWINLTPIRQACKALGLPSSYNGGGWVEGMFPYICSKCDMIFAFFFWGIDELQYIQQNDVFYYAIPVPSPILAASDENVRKSLIQIYTEHNPDVIHIFGTERVYTLETLKLMPPAKVVISITGLVSVCAQHYYGGLEQKEIRNSTLRDMIKGGMRKNKRAFEKYAKTEIQALKAARQVIGRTTWDFACTRQINSALRYYKCNEMLRGVFYEKKWDISKCRKFRIFVSGGNYPLKGIHQAVKALGIIKESYPLAELVVAGNNIINEYTLRDRLAMTSYGKYIKNLIKQNGVEGKVHFIGPLNAEKMAEQYLAANVFVLPSNIENSPNSLGEAMILGLPCVVACIGGVQDLLKDRKEGNLYPYDEPYMLAHYIMCFFEDDELAVKMGNNARQRALSTHNRQEIIENLLAIYEDICKESIDEEASFYGK